MKKKIFALTLLLAVFSVGLVHAETEAITEEIIVADHRGEVGGEVKEIEEVIEDIDQVLEELKENSKNQVDIKNDEELDDEELEEAINEVLNLEEKEDRNRLEAIYHKGQEKIQNITNIVEKQYNMKKQFILNTKEVYQLTYEIQEDLRYLGLEMKDIVKNKDRTIDKEAYGEIRENIANLKKDVKENDYIIGNIVKETKKYILLVKNKQFKDAAKTFENILILQEQQIDLLKTINENITDLKFILTEV